MLKWGKKKENKEKYAMNPILIIRLDDYLTPQRSTLPYEDEREMTEDFLAFLDACLETAFYWKDGHHSRLDLRGVVVTPQEVEQALTERRRAENPKEDEDARKLQCQEFKKMSQYLRSRIAASRVQGMESRFLEIFKENCLTESEQFCLLLALAVEYDRKYERIYGYLQDNVGAKMPTVGLGLSLYHMINRKSALETHLKKRSFLWNLLEEPESWRPQESLLSYPMAVRREVLDWLWGDEARLAYSGPLERMAVWIPPVFKWEDMVLGPNQEMLLRQLKNRIAFRQQVMEQWGFGKKLPYGSGVSALFYGPPGTGKTMGAQVIAADLGLPLYRIDISRIASKYIGETEKNLNALFDEAGRRNIILFFDEADALFAKRSGISNSNDRYANMETGFLLQKIEDYQGITILASNYLDNIDEAFRRRIQYMIRFPFPDEKMRLKIWEKSFPKEAPLNDDICFSEYAGKYELSGSNIKEIALNSAYLAAAQGSEITEEHILKALEIQLEKMGISGKIR